MRTSQIFAAYNDLLALVQQALPTLQGVGAVFDGPQPSIPTSHDLVFVGCDDPLTTSTMLALDAGRQTWLDLGAYSKEETFTIFCSYVAWTGDNNLPDCRARAGTNIGLIETAIRPSRANGNAGMLPSLGPTGWCGLSLGRMSVVGATQGTALHVQFQIDCTTRI